MTETKIHVSNSGIKNAILYERSVEAIYQSIEDFKAQTGMAPDVIMVPLPLVSECVPGLILTEVATLPVSICASLPKDSIIVADTETFIRVKQFEKENGYLTEH